MHRLFKSFQKEQDNQNTLIPKSSRQLIRNRSGVFECELNLKDICNNGISNLPSHGVRNHPEPNKKYSLEKIQRNFEDLQKDEMELTKEIAQLENILLEKNSTKNQDVQEFRRKYSAENFSQRRKNSREQKEEDEYIPSYFEFFNDNFHAKAPIKLSNSKSASELSHRAKTPLSTQRKIEPQNEIPQGLKIRMENIPEKNYEENNFNFKNHEGYEKTLKTNNELEQNYQSLDVYKILQKPKTNISRNKSTNRLISQNSKARAPNVSLPEYRRNSHYLPKSNREDRIINKNPKEKENSSIVGKSNASKTERNLKEYNKNPNKENIRIPANEKLNQDTNRNLDYENFWAENEFRSLLSQEGFIVRAQSPFGGSQPKSALRTYEKEFFKGSEPQIRQFWSKDKIWKDFNTRYKSVERRIMDEKYTPQKTGSSKECILRDRTNDMVMNTLEKDYGNFEKERRYVAQEKNEDSKKSNRTKSHEKEKKEMKSLDKVYRDLNLMRTKNWTPLLSKKI